MHDPVYGVDGGSSPTVHWRNGRPFSLQNTFTASFRATRLPYTRPNLSFSGNQSSIARPHNNDHPSHSNASRLFDSTSTILLGGTLTRICSTYHRLACINTALLFRRPRRRPLKPGLGRLTHKRFGNNLHDPEVGADLRVGQLKAKSPQGFFFQKTCPSSATYVTISLARSLDMVSSGQIMRRFTCASCSHTCTAADLTAQLRLLRR